MADQKISQLTTKATPVSADILPIVDSVAGDNKKVTAGTLPVSTATQTALNAKVNSNSAITGDTKTKITYDSKGLVTAGADATTADINDSTDRRYVTDAQLVVIGNTSGTNTGNQTITLTGDVTGSGTGSFAATIANNAVSNSKLDQMPANTIKGNNTGSTANALDLTKAQVQTLLEIAGAELFTGDGSNGDLSISSGTTTLGVNSYLYNNLTMSGTAQINTSQHPLFVKGTLTISGSAIIQNNGIAGGTNPGTGAGAGGAARAFGRYFASGVAGGGGAAGTTTAGGSAGTTASAGCGPNTRSTNGGRGGSGGTGSAGAAGISGDAANPSIVSWPSYPLVNPFVIVNAAAGGVYLSSGHAGRGGGAGGGNGTNAGLGGGGGGSGAGCVYIACNTLDISGASASAIQAIGGLGGSSSNSVTAGQGGGGGAGGGGGGLVVIAYKELIGSATDLIDVSGGDGGNGGNGGGSGGLNGTGGYGGAGGRVVLINLTTGVITTSNSTAAPAAPTQTGTAGVSFKVSL